MGVTIEDGSESSSPELGTFPAYLTVAEARDLAGALTTLAGMSALLARSDADLASLLVAASLDIDHAMAYQGERYDLSSDQVLAFPRRVGDFAEDPYRPASPTTPTLGHPAVTVWDWDADTNTAVVPEVVKIACLAQAAWLTDAQHTDRLDAIRSGLASQGVGSLSESYVNPKDLPGGLTGLCDRAQRLMDRYRRRTAPLL